MEHFPYGTADTVDGAGSLRLPMLEFKAGAAGRHIGDLDPESELVITSDRGLQALHPRLSNMLSGPPTINASRFPRNSSDLERHLAVLTGRQRFRAITSVGTGRVTDAAKLASATSGLPLTSVVTATTCNSFATDCSVACRDGRLETVRSRFSQRAILDPDVLRNVPKYLNLLGLLDAVSGLTSVPEWRADPSFGQTGPDGRIADDAAALAERAFDRLWLTSDREDLDLRLVVSEVVASAVLVARHGSGQPVSGPEHAIARVLERDYPGSFWHGEAVLFGLIVALRLQSDRARRFPGWLCSRLRERVSASSIGVAEATRIVVSALRTRPERTRSLRGAPESRIRVAVAEALSHLDSVAGSRG